MDRFVAFSWNDEDARATAQADLWSEHLLRRGATWLIAQKRPGLILLVRPRADGSLPVTISGDGDLAIVGSLFPRADREGSLGSSLSVEEVSRILCSNGRRLLENYWGSYVALWRDRESRALSVLRDPCGSTACFRVRTHHINVLCSYVGDAADLPRVRLPIDWTAVAAFLVHDYFITEHTGFEEVQEILPGARWVLHPNGAEVKDWPWNPVELAATPVVQSFDEVKEQLRATARDCFSALGETHSNIVVRLSGGLDSSIVANLMRRASGSHITGIHMVGRGYESFEVQLARLAARNAGIELVELEHVQSTADLRDILAAPRVARPSGQILGASADTLISNACAALGATCILTGHGGDSLFLQRSIARDVLVDFVRLNGLSRRLPRVAYETAVLTQSTMWSVIRNAGAHLANLKRWEPYRFLNQASRDGDEIVLSEGRREIPLAYKSSAWLTEAHRLPPAKAEQVRGIVALRNYHSLLSHGLNFDALQPLVSQPIVELCLRTPAYLFGEGGVDRSLEREAFADIIPPEISHRFQKGFVNHHLAEDVAANASELRSLLLDGNLVANKVVDRHDVEQLFSEDAVLAGRGLNSILTLVAAEAWTVSWQSHLKAA